jgi:hypothetical protein
MMRWATPSKNLAAVDSIVVAIVIGVFCGNKIYVQCSISGGLGGKTSFSPSASTRAEQRPRQHGKPTQAPARES